MPKKMKKKLNILAVSPHADDVEIAMGGTIAKYVAQNHNVTILTAVLPKENILGKVDSFMSKNRILEQKKSAKILGAKVEILSLDPYELSFNRKYIKIFEEKIKEYKPDIIFSCWEYDTHQDHKSVANIIYSVTRKNNISLYMYEAMLPGGFNTHSFNPQLYIDISKFIKVKIKALNEYKSVFKYKKNNYSKYFDSIEGRARFRGETIGVDYAEAFIVVKQIET
jgi:LmbE family N-acetylglucosaminyl deacetylase